MALATVDSYVARYGEVVDQEQVEFFIDDASTLILAEVADSTEEWVTEDADPPGAVVIVCLAIARRMATGRDGVARERLGEYEVQFQDDDVSAIELTKAERRIVRKAAGLGSAQTVELESPYGGGSASSNLDFDFPLETG